MSLSDTIIYYVCTLEQRTNNMLVERAASPWVESSAPNTKTTDTGERGQMFGRTARHVSNRERRVAKPGACSASSETENDGWYIAPLQALPRGALYAIDTHECQGRVVLHGGGVEYGLGFNSQGGLLCATRPPIVRAIAKSGNFRGSAGLPRCARCKLDARHRLRTGRTGTRGGVLVRVTGQADSRSPRRR